MATQIKPFDVSTTDVSHVVIELFGGDNNLSSFVRKDLNEMVAGNKGKFAVLGLADFANTGGQVVEITASKGMRVVRKVGEIDTGDPETLATFIARAMVTYAAVPHRALGFWDHGTGVFDEQDLHEVVLEGARARVAAKPGGRSFPARRLFIRRRDVGANAQVRAMLHDDTSGGVLTNVEAAGVLRAAFKRAGQTRKLDLIFSDTCLNGMIEVLDELEPFAQVVVGSEDLEPGDGWDYERLFKAMTAKPPTTAAAWGRQAVDSFKASYQPRTDQYPCTLAAYKSTNTIPDRFADFVKAVTPLGVDGFRTLSFVRAETQSFARRDTYDLRDFATHVTKEMKGAPKTAATALIASLDKARVGNAALGTDVADATGLAFWFPSDRRAYAATHETYRKLDFDLTTHWADYLSTFLS